MSRRKVVAGAISVLSAALLATVTFVTATDATETGVAGGNSAFALSGSGLLNIDPTPSVNDSNGFSENSLAKVDLPNGLGVAKLLTARAGSGQARASIADVKIGLGEGLPGLTASAIEAKCSGSTGTSALVDAKLGDTPLNVSAPPNTGINLHGVSVYLNKQTKHSDGSITVTAISVKVKGLVGLDLGSVTCGGAGAGVTPPGNGGGNGNPPSSCNNTCPIATAPTPTPVKSHLSVTG